MSEVGFFTGVLASMAKLLHGVLRCVNDLLKALITMNCSQSFVVLVVSVLSPEKSKKNIDFHSFIHFTYSPIHTNIKQKKIGGCKNRTHDLVHAKDALYQLSCSNC